MTSTRDSMIRVFVVGMVAAFAMLLAAGCGGDSASQDEASGSGDSGKAGETTGVSLSGMAREGEELFNVNCSVCHGENATGTNQGPTLIDRIYHPGHHSDASIRNAVSKGVQQHHWVFGDMAPVAVSSDDVEKIICYVRELQRDAEIFEGDDFQTVC